MGGCVSTSRRSCAELDFSLIPNRIVMNGTSRSSCIFTQQGRKGVNQDAVIVWEDFMVDDITFCGVFDGHGPQGHLVARKVRDSLPIKLMSFLNQRKEFRSGSGLYSGGENLSHGEAWDDFCEDKINELWKESFVKSYKAMDKELKSHPNMNCFCSGSTAVTIVKQGMNLFIGNIGDSRAILGSIDANGSMRATQLTVDLKPDLPKEEMRIKRFQGRVFSLQDEPEVARVWLPFCDAPGLAMSRAFGDYCVKDYGVISEPLFTHRRLTESDQFLVLATDGIWDVLSNEDVVKMVSSAPSRSLAAKIIVESAADKWKLIYPTSKMDDCAVACLFLDGKMDSKSDHIEQLVSVGLSEEDDSFQSLVGMVIADPMTDEDQNWSGLEGVTRVNSLIQLPRLSEERPSLYNP